MNKKYITSSQLQQDSFELAKTIVESGYRPTFLVGIWRGGTPIAIAVHEVLQFCGIECDHISIRTSSYSNIGQRTNTIKIHGLNSITDNTNENDRLLIIDDVHDTGLSMDELVKNIEQVSMPQQIKVATAYFKPKMNQVDWAPDFYVKETDQWLVFPHELAGLSHEELINNKPEIAQIRELLAHHSLDKASSITT